MVRKIPNPIDVHVGGRIRLRRMLIGMSQEKLGAQLSLTFQQVQKYEKGTNRVGASRLFHIAQILGIEVQSFFENLPLQAMPDSVKVPGMAEAPSENFVLDYVQSSEGLELNKAFANIKSVPVRRRVLELIKELAARPAN